MDPFANANPVLTSAIVLLVCVVLEKVLPWRDSSHPLVLMRLFARNLAKKTVKKNRSVGQQKLAGVLAIAVLVLPLCIFMFTFLWFAEYSWFFSGMFLLVALRFNPTAKQTQKIEHLLKSNKKALARNQLQRIVLRQTDNLSSMGIVKATMETFILRFHYQYICTLFWYLILGGAGALVYRCCYEMSQEWNIKSEQFKHYGRPVSWLCLLLQWIPVRLSGLLFTATLGLMAAYRSLKALTGNVSTHTLLLAIFAGALGCRLGGPAYYQNKKMRLPKCGNDRDPDIADVSRLRTLIIQYQIILFATMAVLFLGAYSVLSQLPRLH